MGWINLIAGFLRLGPIALGLIAAAVFAGGFALQVQQNGVLARYDAALAAGRPAPVDIQSFDAGRHTNPVDEAHLRAQILTDAGYELTLTEGSRDQKAFMMPLLATDSTAPEVIGVALWTSPNFDFDYITDARLAAKADSMGTFGFVSRFNGRVADLGKWDEIVNDALREEGLALPANAVVLFPYTGGRQVALSREGKGEVFGLFSKIGGVIALFALLKLVIRTDGRKEDEVPEPAAAPMMAETAPVMPTNPALHADGGVPLWKQRIAPGATEPTYDRSAVLTESEWADTDDDAEDDLDWPAPSYGIIGETTAAVPEMPAALAEAVPDEDEFAFPKASYGIVDETAPQAASTPALDHDAPVQSRRGFSLRKALIVLVGGAFAVMLLAVVVGLVSDTVATEQGTSVTIADPVERMAERLADELIPPSADHDRPFYQVDVSGVARWFLVKGVMALNGDSGAIILLMSIIGGIFLVLFMARYYFFARRFFSHKVSPDIANMGFN